MFANTAMKLRQRALRFWNHQRTIATVISGNKISQQVTERLKKDVAEMRNECPGFRPSLMVLQVGDRIDSNLYISMKLKAAAAIEINANHIRLPKTATEVEVLQSIAMFNENPEVHGLIVQLPLDSVNPIDSEKVTNAVAPEKDVDGLSSENAGKLARGDLNNCFIPCTPSGVLELIRHTGVAVSGKNAVVIGRSKIVGGPMYDLLLWNHATVTSCHSKTPDLFAQVKRADILVAGAGKAEMVKGDWLKEGAIVIDVGINYVPDSTRPGGMRMVGDVHYPSAKERAGYITPVPGGVGPMTVAMLMENTVKSAKQFLKTYRPGKWNISYNKLKAQTSQPRKPIGQLAKEIGLFSNDVELYGRGRAKVNLDVLKRLNRQSGGKYVLVSGVTPTSMGECQSAVTLGLAQALGAHLKVNSIACVAQPSLRHSFAIRGGALGGGYSQIPLEEVSLQPLGDTEAVSTASSLIMDAITAYCHHQSTLSDQALFDLVLPIRDGLQVFSPSQLRRLQRLNIEISDPLILTEDEIRRFVRLDINPNTMVDLRTLETEIKAIVSLSSTAEDLQLRLAKMVVANSQSREPVTTDDLGLSRLLALLTSNSLKPCLMQSLEGTPVFLHTSPLADGTQGSPSVMADKMALKLVGPQGFVVSETTPDSMDKFLSIACRSSDLQPSVLVLVYTVQALKMFGDSPRSLKLLEKGSAYLRRKVKEARVYGLPVIVAVNNFSCDTEAEVELVCSQARQAGAFEAVHCNSWSNGGTGALNLAQSVQRAAETPSTFQFLYDLQMPVIDKITKVAQKMMGAKDVKLSPNAEEKLDLYIKQGFGNLPVCIIKTNLCQSDISSTKVVPTDSTLSITDIQAYAGAGFLGLVLDMAQPWTFLEEQGSFWVRENLAPCEIAAEFNRQTNLPLPENQNSSSDPVQPSWFISDLQSSKPVIALW